MASKQFKEKPVERFPKLREKYDLIEKLQGAHLGLVHDMLMIENGRMYDLDQFMLTVLNRSMNLVDGIVTLTEHWNSVSAIALLRLQVDNLLRAYYIARKKDERHEILKQWREGKRWDKIKNPDGERLSDKLMLELAEKQYDWVREMYERTCNHVHLSFSSHFGVLMTGYDPQEDVAKMSLGIGSEHWSEELIDKFLYDVGNVTDAIMKIALGWNQNKEDIMTKKKEKEGTE